MRGTDQESYPRALGVSFCALVLLAPAPCWAEAASEGIALYEQARFEEAAAAFERVLADSGATSDQIAVAYLHLAALRLVAGDEEAATRHARAAAALDPGASPPEGAPLRLEELLAEAVAAQPEGGLSVSVEAPSCPAAGAPVQARAEVGGAPEGLVSSVVLRCVCGEASQEAEGEGARPVELVLDTGGAAPGDSLECQATLRSPSGASLRTRRLQVALCRPGEGGVDEGSEAPTAPEEPVGGSSHVWIWVGVSAAVVAVATAVTLGVIFGTAPTDAQVGAVEIDGP